MVGIQGVKVVPDYLIFGKKGAKRELSSGSLKYWADPEFEDVS